MGLISLIVTVVIVALIVWLVDRFAPIRPVFKQIVFWLAIIGIAFLILDAFGVWAYIKDVTLPRLNRRG